MVGVIARWKAANSCLLEVKDAIEVESIDELVPTLESIKQSIDLGDLDIFIG
jgi:hypothetical protein